MDLDKALYMSEFLKIREDLGTTEIYPVTNTLYSNLYDEFKQNEKIEEVKDSEYVIVLDPPEAPLIRSEPQKRKTVKKSYADNFTK